MVYSLSGIPSDVYSLSGSLAGVYSLSGIPESAMQYFIQALRALRRPFPLGLLGSLDSLGSLGSLGCVCARSELLEATAFFLIIVAACHPPHTLQRFALRCG